MKTIIIISIVLLLIYFGLSSLEKILIKKGKLKKPEPKKEPEKKENPNDLSDYDNKK